MIRTQDEPIHNTGEAPIVSNLASSTGAKPDGLLTESHAIRTCSTPAVAMLATINTRLKRQASHP